MEPALLSWINRHRDPTVGLDEVEDVGRELERTLEPARDGTGDVGLDHRPTIGRTAAAERDLVADAHAEDGDRAVVAFDTGHQRLELGVGEQRVVERSPRLTVLELGGEHVRAGDLAGHLGDEESIVVGAMALEQLGRFEPDGDGVVATAGLGLRHRGLHQRHACPSRIRAAPAARVSCPPRLPSSGRRDPVARCAGAQHASVASLPRG